MQRKKCRYFGSDQSKGLGTAAPRPPLARRGTSARTPASPWILPPLALVSNRPMANACPLRRAWVSASLKPVVLNWNVSGTGLTGNQKSVPIASFVSEPMRKAGQAETASRMNEWLTSPGLPSPK
jgi:hypothetical protein